MDVRAEDQLYSQSTFRNPQCILKALIVLMSENTKFIEL